MKKPTILRSLHDLAESKAKGICSPDYPHYSSFVDAYEKIILDGLVEREIIRTNAWNVTPVLHQFVEENKVLPFLYAVDGKPISRIRSKSSTIPLFQVSCGDEEWCHLSDEDIISLYEALNEEGLLPFSE